jgi:hypothetical protein
LPHRTVHYDSPVVPSDHPFVSRRHRGDPSEEFVGVNRFPAREMVDGIELDIRDAKDTGDAFCQTRFARAGVPHN